MTTSRRKLAREYRDTLVTVGRTKDTSIEWDIAHLRDAIILLLDLVINPIQKEKQDV